MAALPPIFIVELVELAVPLEQAASARPPSAVPMRGMSDFFMCELLVMNRWQKRLRSR